MCAHTAADARSKHVHHELGRGTGERWNTSFLVAKISAGFTIALIRKPREKGFVRTSMLRPSMHHKADHHVLCFAVLSAAELIRHEDHFDRVPVWDATRSNSWENHNHYSGGYGGRWLLSFFKIAHNKESKPQQGDKHQQGTPVAGDKVVGKSRSLLGTQDWGSSKSKVLRVPRQCTSELIFTSWQVSGS
jgi:hypothetical protein